MKAKTKICGAALLGLMLVAVPASGQTLDDIVTAEEAVIAAWQQTPLTFRTSLFADSKPQGFGIYVERAHNEYAPGEPIIVYAEPVGYGWHESPDGTYTFGFNVDFLLKDDEGRIVAGQENFQQLELNSRFRNREFMLVLTLTVDGAPAGSYTIEYRVRDVASDKEGTIALPFHVVD
ncbi:hypothetical protein [Mesorhizobium sp. Z1-4]|uniref:hypothetical protein n=1 Tax=Mesorhizobium sp. Z1-4 TaxID=2448478 RepID=UPI000FDB6F7F|nr:hypothetical protein [Mesorhizobium sp. Z1-4]